MRDYESAYAYYKAFSDARETYQLDMYRVEDIKIANVMAHMGKEAEAEKFFQNFQAYSKNDASIYQQMNLSMASAYEGDTTLMLEQLNAFTKQDNYHYWILLFFESDPLMDGFRELPEFKEVLRTLESKFWIRHEKIKTVLEEQNLI